MTRHLPKTRMATRAALALALAGAALAATPALASLTLPGVGVIVKSHRSAITAPSDANGEVRLTGLEPGDYDIAPLRLTAAAPVRNTSVRVGEDGRLAFAVREERLPVDPRVRYAQPPVRRWVEAIPFDNPARSDGATINVREVLRAIPTPCAPPPPGVPSTCTTFRNHIDINASPATEMLRHAPGLGPRTAESIVAERVKSGPFTTIEDFSRRICPAAEVDFGQAPVRFGPNLLVLNLPATAKSSVPGFRCAPGDNMFRLYAAWHTYVGHVTLLR